jgi:hypothetical protein
MDAKPSRRAARSATLLSGLALALTACAGLSMERDTATSGTFRSSALTFTVLSLDMPGETIAIAQGNVADSGQPNLVIEGKLFFPYLGPLDWLLDIVSLRYARISGTWGFPTE